MKYLATETRRKMDRVRRVQRRKGKFFALISNTVSVVFWRKEGRVPSTNGVLLTPCVRMDKPLSHPIHVPPTTTAATFPRRARALSRWWKKVFLVLPTK